MNVGIFVDKIALHLRDDHKAGVMLGQFQSPIGNPTTMVLADELSVAGIIDGVKNGRTVVKLQEPSDPMIDLVSEVLESVPTNADSVRLGVLRLML